MMTQKRNFSSFSSNSLNVAIIGASGGIGRAFVEQLSAMGRVQSVYAFSRSGVEFDDPKITNGVLDFEDEASVEAAAQLSGGERKLDLIIVATGILHDGDILPEKSLRDINAENFAKVFAVNTRGPALVAKHFLKYIHRDQRSVFVALSARVGSIEDNGLGGWYAYRASKAALNMVLKNTAIEIGRRHKHAVIAALHPGTVDTNLSEPFQGNVPDGKLFTPEHAAACLLQVIDGLKPADSGKLVAWDGEVIAY